MPKHSETIIEWFKSLQDSICKSLEDLDGSGHTFKEDLWTRDGGGGGRTRIFKGDLIEKGGVNFSAVHGQMPEKIAKSLGLKENKFLATGVSIVLHARSPHIPIIHMNVRYFETDQGDWWFGGGIDVTPHYIIEDQAAQVHKHLKTVCDEHDPTYYPKYKEWADNYFYIKHRDETRGIGGIFFDRLNSEVNTLENNHAFVKAVGSAFVPIYTDLVGANINKPVEEKDTAWQAIRRGRYVEFNLVWDRGTKFGLDTNGRTESILMSLPPMAEWHYAYSPDNNPLAMKTQSLLKKGIDWVGYQPA